MFTNLTAVLADFPTLRQATSSDLLSLILVSSYACMTKLSNPFGGTAFGIPGKFKHSLLNIAPASVFIVFFSLVFTDHQQLYLNDN